MSSVSFAEIETYLKNSKSKFSTIGKDVEDGVRDPENHMADLVYAVKFRVKTLESAYLKTKRDTSITTPRGIKDYCGIRILCLFERDLEVVNGHLLRFFNKVGYTQQDLKVFNFDRDSYKRIRKVAESLDWGSKVREPKNKRSGYKSIHYRLTTQVNGHHYFFEVQLRTLIQDVWGELEHSLNYKKRNVHPHIKKSFELLSNDLSNVDELMEHLKDISEKDQNFENMTMMAQKPQHYFGYEDEILPVQFAADSAKDAYRSYCEAVKAIKFKENEKKNKTVDSLDRKLKALKKIIAVNVSNYEKKKDLNYWFKMEEAYIYYCKSDFKAAREIYEALKKKKEYATRYCLQFRLGQMCAIMGEDHLALREFDECESNMVVDTKHREIKNEFYINMAIAFIYWRLGEEFIDIAISKIEEAQKVFDSPEFASVMDAESRVKEAEAQACGAPPPAPWRDELDVRLQNNIVWYYLAKYTNPRGDNETQIRNNRTADYSVLKAKFARMEELLDRDAKGEIVLTSSAIDTAAWVYYHRYLRERKATYYRRAFSLCNDANERTDFSTLGTSVYHLRHSHKRDILSLDSPPNHVRPA